MKAYKGFAAALVLAAALALPSFAQKGQDPVKELSAKNLSKFLADYAGIMKDMETVQDQIDSDFDPFSDASASGPDFDIVVLKANVKKAADNPKIAAILKKYSWDDEFWDVLITVTFCALYIQMEQLNAGQSMPQLQDYLNSMKAGLHPDDIALVKEKQGPVFQAMGM